MLRPICNQALLHSNNQHKVDRKRKTANNLIQIESEIKLLLLAEVLVREVVLQEILYLLLLELLETALIPYDHHRHKAKGHLRANGIHHQFNVPPTSPKDQFKAFSNTIYSDRIDHQVVYNQRWYLQSDKGVAIQINITTAAAAVKQAFR
uniref:Uncharacterized protein n=1 Tax=Anopheles albimanus TaxID=7167 RepID=A0A182FT68_ANOAL